MSPENQRQLLVQIAREQNPSAFAKLFEYFAPRVKTYLQSRGAEAQVAEDLAQDALLTVWRKAPLFDAEKGLPSTWIYTIARNRYFDLVRRERYATFGPDHWLPEEENPFEQLESFQSGQTLGRLLETLPAELAQTVRLAYLTEKTQEQIAVELDISLPTVKSRLRRAMAQLRRVAGEAP